MNSKNKPEICGLTWEQIQTAQREGKIVRPKIDLSTTGDYGSDPIGEDQNGIFRWKMIPSGKIVDAIERQRLLKK